MIEPWMDTTAISTRFESDEEIRGGVYDVDAPIYTV